MHPLTPNIEMGSQELSLDYKPNIDMTLPKPLEVDKHEQTQRLEEFIARLEQERVKIDAFKRELPLCMQLLNNAMETYRRQLAASNGGEKPVAAEEFIPVKQKSDKESWMASVQLWNQTEDDSTKRWNGGAFVPFSKEKSKTKPDISDLALAPAEEKEETPSALENKRERCNHVANVDHSSAAQARVAGQQTQRKARRCWSPDLHRRFVNALQALGGSQVATPKQIRELMKVEGLTNDEVKSHLQKYRLHTRRPIPATPQAAVPAGAPQLVVLGGIWVPPEYATSTYGGHPPSNAPHFCSTATPPVPVRHDFYPPTIGCYKGGQRPVESDVRDGGEERTESTQEEVEEEGRRSGSSSYSGGGGKGGGDDGNNIGGSEVSLKF